MDLYEADWEGEGKIAGHNRNLAMAANAGAVIALWDGKSPGTRDMIDIATDKGLKVGVETY